MRHRPFVPEQRLLQSDVYVHVEVVLHAFEQVVGLLLQHDNDVALQHIWHLFTLSLEDDPLLVSHAFRDVNCDRLLVLDDFFALAGFAVFLVDLTTSCTLVARLLHLHLHESHVLGHRNLAFSLALGALLLLAALGTGALALAAVDVAIDVELHLGPGVQLLQRHLQLQAVLWTLSAIVDFATP